MTETIEITNGVVSLVEKKVVRNVSVKSFKEALLATLGLRSPILPPNTVTYAQKDDISLYLLETSPSKRTIKHRNGRNVKEYTIAIPYAYFLTVFKTYALEDLYLFFSPKKIESVEDMLYYPPLPNIFPECNVCLGDYRFNVTSSISTKIVSVIDFFWASPFNRDANTLYLEKMPRKIRNLSEDDYFGGWEKVSEAEICNIGWIKCKSVEEVVGNIVGDIESDDE